MGWLTIGSYRNACAPTEGELEAARQRAAERLGEDREDGMSVFGSKDKALLRGLVAGLEGDTRRHDWSGGDYHQFERGWRLGYGLREEDDVPIHRPPPRDTGDRQC